MKKQYYFRRGACLNDVESEILKLFDKVKILRKSPNLEFQANPCYVNITYTPSEQITYTIMVRAETEEIENQIIGKLEAKLHLT